MSTSAAQARLKDGLRELHAAWRRSQEHWRDQTAEEFGKDVIEPLEPRVRQTLNAMAALGEALEAARRESE